MSKTKKSSVVKPWEEIILLSNITSYEQWGSWITPDDKPLSFFEFVYSDLHEPKFSPLQEHITSTVVGEGGLEGDVRKFFTRGTRPLESILYLGKGSGKGFMASDLILYLIYLLHWLPTLPSDYFNLSKADELAIVLVATNKEQAGKTFRRIINRLMNSKFFRRFPIEQSGKIQNSSTADRSLPPVKISMSISGAGIALFSSLQLYLNVVPSKNESFEGNTLIGWVMDEASGFVSDAGLNNAEAIYKTLTTSVRELPYMGIITSFPRRDANHDFTHQKFLEVVGADPDGNPLRDEYFNKETLKYAIRAKTWEVKPAHFYSGKTFYFSLPDMGIEEEVPIEYKTEFDKYPYDSVAKYMCIPAGFAQARFSQIIVKVPATQFILEDLNPLFTIQQNIIYNPDKDLYLIQYDPDTLQFARRPDSGVEYFIGLDAGESDCRAVIAIGHIDVTRGTRPFLLIDQLIVYVPDEKKKLRVDLLNFFHVIVRISKILNIRRIKSDRWNTTAFKYSVRDWDDKPVNRNDYELMVNMMSADMLKLANQPESYEFVAQVKSLVDVSPTKKPAATGYQDIADAVAGCAHIAGEILKINPNTIDPSADIEESIIKEIAQNRGLATGTLGVDPHEQRIQRGLRNIVPQAPSLGTGTLERGGSPFPAVGGGGVTGIPDNIRRLLDS